MAVENEQRDYNFTDPELALFASDLVSDMTRDATEFEKFGVDQSQIDVFQELGNQFEIFPSDEMLEGDSVIATDDKNAKLEQVKEKIRNMSMRIEMKWGENSGQHKRLGIKGMSGMSDGTLLYTARRVHTVMTEYLADLADEGLTQQLLDDFSDLNEEFEIAKNVQHDKVNDRDVKRIERIRLGNELYSFVSKYCDIGKRVWFKLDPAKYDDYVIYSAGTGAGTPSIPPVAPVLSYSPEGFSWDAVQTATSYQLVYHAVGDTEWIELYSGAMPEEPVPFNPDNGIYIARLRVRNAAGYGDFSSEINVTIGLQPPEIWELVYNSGTSQVTLQWNNSIGTSENDIYQSVVPIGDPAGAFTLIESISAQLYQHEVTNYDVTEYYYIIARNATESSEPTATISVDVPV